MTENICSAGPITLKIAKLAHDGRGIGFIPDPERPESRGKAVFVKDSLPGQTVICIPVRDKVSYLEAVSQKIIHADGPVSAPICKHHHECGGCPLQTMPYDQQLLWKENLALEALKRIGRFGENNLAAIWRKPVPSPKTLHFRNKLELAFGNDASGQLAIGFRKRSSHAVFNLTDCALMKDGALKIASACRTLAQNSGLSAYEKNNKGFWRFLVLRQARTIAEDNMRWSAICLTSRGSDRERKIVANLGAELLGACQELACFIHEERNSRDLLAIGETRICSMAGRDKKNSSNMVLPLGGKLFRLDPASFFQVNGEASQILANIVMDMDGLDKKNGGLLDLYCGAGAPGLLLAPNYSFVLGMEYDRRACKYASVNAAAMGVNNSRYLFGNINKIMRGHWQELKNRRWSAVLADPPRAGIGADVISAILRLAPEKIIYVSCNPATLARDALLMKKRYRLASLASVDLFPHTPHLECCGLWLKHYGFSR